MLTAEIFSQSGKKGTIHRAIEILKLLHRLAGSARTAHLAEVMSVSEETVRRTVKKLSKKGLVSRVHGGVFLTGEEAVPAFFRCICDRSREKKRTGRAAASLVGDGCPLFLDAGSTTYFVADALAHKSGLRVAANAINVANSLIRNTGNRVHIAGGELQFDKCGAFGSETLGFIETFFFDMVILGANAFDRDHGFLLHDPDEAAVARKSSEGRVEPCSLSIGPSFPSPHRWWREDPRASMSR